MKSKSLVEQCICAPGSFAGLMAIYEQNYLLIRELLGKCEVKHDEYVSRCSGHLPLQLRVLERFRYTTTYSLTYLFREKGLPRTEPDLVVRVYRDAAMAEVMGFGDEAPTGGGMPAGPQRVDGWVLERKWQLNRFLEKWLEYCLNCGHRFAESTDPVGY
jgi:uncharacterized protein YqiB (DUF1249 family)